MSAKSAIFVILLFVALPASLARRHRRSSCFSRYKISDERNIAYHRDSHVMEDPFIFGWGKKSRKKPQSNSNTRPTKKCGLGKKGKLHYFQDYLIPFNFRAPLIFAQLKRAKNEGARKWPIFAHDGARKLKGAN